MSALKLKATNVSNKLKASPSYKKFSSASNRDPRDFDDRPKPINFDKFLPWICLEMEVKNVVVVQRTKQAKLQKAPSRHPSTVKLPSVSSRHSSAAMAKMKLKQDRDSVYTNKGVDAIECQDNDILVIACYDSFDHLAELTIKGCGTDIPSKVLQAITLCLPFHPYLYKVAFLNGVHTPLLGKISKMLTHSKLTNVCLDNSKISDGSYYVLLESASKLKYLSLSRCSIDDKICYEIFSRLDLGCPCEKTVMVVDLSSNLITDEGAKVIGQVLRKNRHLLHLNLGGNRITDVGLYFIMEHLMEFPLTFDEAVKRKLRYMEYSKDKAKVYKKCVEEIRNFPTTFMEARVNKSSIMPHRSVSNKQLRKKGKKNLINVELDPERKTRDIIGPFEDPYKKDSVITKDGYCYCVGNFKLCSLNMSYNNLELLSLMKILEVLRYQYACEKKSSTNTGLVKIVIDGNYFPQWCPELNSIEDYLFKTIREQSVISLPGWYKRRTSSSSSKFISVKKY